MSRQKQIVSLDRDTLEELAELLDGDKSRGGVGDYRNDARQRYSNQSRRLTFGRGNRESDGPRDIVQGTFNKTGDLLQKGVTWGIEKSLKIASPQIAAAVATVLKDVVAPTIDAIIGEVNNGLSIWEEIEFKALSTGRAIGMTKKQLGGMNEQLRKATGLIAAQFDMSFKDISDIQKSYSDTSARATILSRSELENAAAYKKILGSTYDEAVGKLAELGASTDTTGAYLGLTEERAMRFGLNLEKTTKAFVKDIGMLNRYTFKQGIDGLSKMEILSQRLRINMQQIGNAVEKFETIESSIETSANLQVLGGSFATNFSNPLQNMGLALTDMEGFMQNVTDTFANKGVLNRQTGIVEFAPIDKAFMREAAKHLGMTYDEVVKMASSQVSNKEVEAQMNASIVSEEDKAAISNLAKYNAEKQKYEITYYDENGDEQTVEVGNVTQEMLRFITPYADKESIVQDQIIDIAKNVRELNGNARSRTKDSISLKERRQGVNASADAGMADSILVNEMKIHNKGGMDLLGRFVSKFPLLGSIGRGIWEGSFGNFFRGKEDGGIIGGPDSGGKDNQISAVASGEMILNKPQQSNLFSLLQNSGMAFADGGISGADQATLFALANTKMNGNSEAPLPYQAQAAWIVGKSVVNASSKVVKSSYDVSKSLVQSGFKFLRSAAPFMKETLIASKNNIVSSNILKNGASVISASGQVLKSGALLIKDGSVYIGKGIYNVSKSFGGSVLDKMMKGGRYVANSRLGQFVGKKATSIASTAARYGRNLALDGYLLVGRPIENAFTRAMESQSVVRLRASLSNFSTSVGTFKGSLKGLNGLKGEVLTKGSNVASTIWKNKSLLMNPNELAFKIGNKGLSIMKDASASKATTEFGKALYQGSNRFIDASREMSSKFASVSNRLGGVKTSLTNFARNNAVTKYVGSKATSILGNGIGKNALKKIPVLGTAISVGIAGVEAFNAVKNHGKAVAAIKSDTNLSASEKRKMIETADNNRNEAIGKAAGAAIGAAAFSLIPGLGPVIGGIVGGFIGDKVGGFIGRNAKSVKNFLFGKENGGMSDEDLEQQSYEETKFGQSSIEEAMQDSSGESIKIMAAQATVKMHDTLISMWYHMNGKMSNGEEEERGLIPAIGSALASAATLPLRLTTRMIGGLFGSTRVASKKESVENGNAVSETSSDENAILLNAAYSTIEIYELLSKRLGVSNSSNEVFSIAVSEGNGSVKNPIVQEENSNIETAPLNTQRAEVIPNGVMQERTYISEKTNTTINSFVASPQPNNINLNLNVSGTIKLNGGGNSSMSLSNSDISKLLANEEFKRKLIELVSDSVSMNVFGGGKVDRNSWGAATGGIGGVRGAYAN